jgi:signal transduction histidine kinase
MKAENSPTKSGAKSVYERMIDVFFFFKPIADLNKIVHHDFIGYGTAAHEFFRSRMDVTEMAERQSEQLQRQNAEIHRKLILERVFAEGTSCLIIEEFDLYFKDISHRMVARLSTILERIDDQWVVTHFHGSTPDSNIAEDEALPMEGLRKKNEELEAKIKERTRDLEIEMALERVRARTMAMQHSDELAEASFLLDQQVRALGIKTWGCAFNIYRDKDAIEWFGNEKGVLPTYTVPRKGIFKKYYDYGRKGHSIYVQEISGKKCIDHYEYMGTLPVIGDVLKQLKKANGSFPEFQIDHVAYFKYGYLLFITLEPVPEAHDIFKRFAKVFEQTYTRFLDLQKAEAQAREAEIELALERVRARTMSMHKSTELNEVAFVLFEQIRLLGGNLWGTGFALCNTKEGEDEFWFANEMGVMPPVNIPNTKDEVHITMYTAWKNKQEYLKTEKEGKELKAHYNYLNSLPAVKAFFQPMLDAGIQFPDWQQWHAAYFSKGYLLIITVEPYAEPEIFKRFAKVFDQTYTRFLDLQNAESLAHKAKIEVALERVRARALAMQQPEELVEVADVMRHEMGLLGVEALETSSIYLNKTPIGEAECWYSLKDIREEEKKFVADHFALNYDDTWVGRQMLDFHLSKEKEVSIVMQGNHRKEWIDYCAQRSPVFQGYYGEVIPERTYHLCKFSNGAIGAATPGEISSESWDLLRRAAAVFSLAYSRFKDLTQARYDLQRLKEEKQRAESALTELKATQSQLIQSEKMASLGELTAGIAHEIQNPLNFVNNFSEVSNELIDEMKEEFEKGDKEEAFAIADDIKQNLEKINHHGKRADAIVKGMLQHSRSSSGLKEPTDINALADEYLRLAYHGLRAKDKSFNATMNTDFDASIGNVNVVPQDMGRVILNLITNAFYTITERKNAPRPPEGGVTYEPTVWVSTKRLPPPLGVGGENVEISVRDNGNGIPENVKEKIFQPFFTTKPTGQGTGLGLSLSYDIIKAHGGELKVETEKGVGTTLRINLPLG